MFRYVTKRQYQKAWESMNRHDYEAIIRQFAPNFEVTFVGDTSLGGSRRTKDAMRRWFQRFFRFFPDARFEMQDLAIDGPPWNTRMFGAFEITATVLGAPYRNGVHPIREDAVGPNRIVRDLRRFAQVLAGDARYERSGHY
jgi:ketosteroid isomerase-like protein